MLPFPLQIRYRELPQREPAAWLVPGDDVALWMEEWLRWDLPQEEWRVVILPGWGALTFLGPKQTPAVSPRAVALGRVSSRVLVPLPAEISPAVSAEELEKLVSTDFAVAVFHPARGLLVVETSELRTISDFLASPPLSALDWTVAQPGLALNERLLSVQPAMSLSIADVLEQGRGDIGSQNEQFGDLPPRPNEPGNGLIQRAGRSLLTGIAKAVSGLASLFEPKQSATPTAQRPQGSRPNPSATGAGAAGAGGNWLRAISQWANSKLAGVSRQLDEMRNKELHRLMHLLQTNPDEGLKFALPFSGGDQHRGLATPGGMLGARDVNFNLSRLGGGGGRADVWNVPNDFQVKLAQRYRELANRELQLGRHRRAAYIFAELLSDLDAAASALLAGEHWREAAVLYRDRLKRPLVAAQCLEKGGLLHEAIAIYETLREYEKIGDLYQRLEQRDDALQAWKTAAAAYEGNRDHFRAAQLIEEKVADPDAAAQILSRSWLAGNKPRESLEKLFGLFARHAWHERARQRIKELRDELNTDSVALAGSEALASIVHTYPERNVTTFAADTARVLIGIHLAKAGLDLRTRLVAALQALVPADKLLQRDGARYLRELAATPPAVKVVKENPPATSRSNSRAPQLVRSFRLPEATTWETFAAQGPFFYALGNVNGAIDLRVGDWFGQFETCPLQRKLSPGWIEPTQVAADPQNHGPFLIATGFGTREFQTAIPWSPASRRVVLLEGEDLVLAARYRRVGVCYALNRAFIIEHDLPTDMLVAKGRVVHGNQTLGEIATTFNLCQPEADNLPIPTHGRSDLLAVAHFNQLLLVRGENDIERIEFAGAILQITGSAPFTRPRLAVVTTEGTYLVWLPGAEQARTVRCGVELDAPVASFTIGGRLVLVAASGGEVYETSGGQLTLHSRLPWQGQPLAVLPTDEPDQFAVVSASGMVSVYKIG